MSVDQKANLEAALEGYFKTGDVNARELVDSIMAATRQDRRLGDLSRRSLSGPAQKEPELIQGYTAEQWQEIEEGEYLCEFGVLGRREGEWVGFTSPFKGFSKDGKAITSWGVLYDKCRPAQIKGVMRPIWVEPVDKEAECVFFSDDKRVSGSTNRWEDYPRTSDDVCYIEL